MTAAKASLANPHAKALRKAALVYPDTVEDFPWDHHAYKTPNKKGFLFLTGLADGGFDCSMKLPFRNHEALKLKGAEPTGYGLGKSGWVTFTFGQGETAHDQAHRLSRRELARRCAEETLRLIRPPGGGQATETDMICLPACCHYG